MLPVASATCLRSHLQCFTRCKPSVMGITRQKMQWPASPSRGTALTGVEPAGPATEKLGLHLPRTWVIYSLLYYTMPSVYRLHMRNAFQKSKTKTQVKKSRQEGRVRSSGTRPGSLRLSCSCMQSTFCQAMGIVWLTSRISFHPIPLITPAVVLNWG